MISTGHGVTLPPASAVSGEGQSLARRSVRNAKTREIMHGGKSIGQREGDCHRMDSFKDGWLQGLGVVPILLGLFIYPRNRPQLTAIASSRSTLTLPSRGRTGDSLLCLKRPHLKRIYLTITVDALDVVIVGLARCEQCRLYLRRDTGQLD